MSGWMKSTGVNVKKATEAEGTGSGWKEGKKVNCRIERCAMDSTDNEFVVKQHGAGADEFPNIMLRVQGDKDGRFKNSCIFQKLYLFSENAVRASGDCQFLATYAAIKDEEDAGYYADLIESDEKPDNEILADLIGLEVGITVGVMDNGGKQSVFVRKVEMPFDWDKLAEKETNKGSSDEGRGRRGRGGNGGGEASTEDGNRGRRGRAR